MFASVEKFQLLRAGISMRSKYTGKRKRVNFPFAVWVLEGTLIDTDGTDAADLRAFLVQLEGERNSFRLKVPGHDKPSSGYTGPNGLVATAAAAGVTSLATKSWSNSVPVLRKGDYFTINDELKMATSTVSSSGTGTCTLDFQPQLRKGALVNDVVVVQTPTMLMTGQDDDSGTWSLKRPVRHGIKLKLMEDF
jgi:hypothetical protein